MPAEYAIAFVKNDDGDVVGLAFACDRGHVYTCAHVVNVALGREGRHVSRPRQRDTIELTFPAAGDAGIGGVSASVVSWGPEDIDVQNDDFAAKFDSVDVAVLGMNHRRPGVSDTLLFGRHNADDEATRPPAIDDFSGPVRLFGPVAGGNIITHVDCEIRGIANSHLITITQRNEGQPTIRSGFSGGPIIRPRTLQVLGMVHSGAIDGPTPEIYAIRPDVLSCYWPRGVPSPFTLTPTPTPTRTRTRTPPRQQQLVGKLLSLVVLPLLFASVGAVFGIANEETVRRCLTLAGIPAVAVFLVGIVMRRLKGAFI